MRLGIMGTNFIGDRLLEAAEAMDASWGVVEPYAVYSRKRETGKDFALRHGISEERIYTDMEAFFRSGIEAVYVATPNFCHKSHSLAAINAGLHVLCEKPLALTAADGREMFLRAEEKGVILMEAMRPCHDPAWRAVRETLPLIAPVRRVHLEYCQYSSRYDKFKQGEVLNAFNPALGNAAVMDIGVYPLFVLGMLLGKPLATHADSTFLANGFEGEGHASFRYDGVLADVTWSKITDSVAPSYILGEGGSITVDKVSTPAAVTLTLRGGDARSLPVRKEENNMDYELEAFLRLVGSSAEEYAKYRACSETALEILDAVRESAGIRFV